MRTLFLQFDGKSLDMGDDGAFPDADRPAVRAVWVVADEIPLRDEVVDLALCEPHHLRYSLRGEQLVSWVHLWIFRQRHITSL